MPSDLFARPADPVIGARSNGNGHVVVTRPQRFRPHADVGAMLLICACVLLAALAATMGIVSWHAQFAYVLAVKHQHLASALEALGLDAGAVIFSVLGIALARLGRRAVIERALVCLCALGSCTMNLLGADLGSPRSVAVYVMPPLLFAAGSDRLIAVVRRSALGHVEDEDSQRSAWRTGGVAALYVLRFALAPPATALGVRRLVLEAAPLPAATPAPAIEGPEVTQPASGKQAHLIALAARRHDLRTLPLTDVSAIATALAPEAELHPSTARRVLLTHVRKLQSGGAAC